jgi:hypothetical protein
VDEGKQQQGADKDACFRRPCYIAIFLCREARAYNQNRQDRQQRYSHVRANVPPGRESEPGPNQLREQDRVHVVA